MGCEMKNELKIGDKVEIVKYGSLMWSRADMALPVVSREPEITWYDLRSDLVGKIGTITEIKEPQPGYVRYAMADMSPDKTAWYGAEQLKLVKKGENHE